jgi:Leucine Rich repeat
MLERYGFYLLALGVAIGAVGYLWLVAVAFKQRVGWGVGLLLLPPLALLFLGRHSRKARGPVLVIALSGLVVATPYGLGYYERHFAKLGPHEQLVDGELRITLTGLQDFDYASLRSRPDVAVLQMANPDVDDQTLEHLRGLEHLRSLDLSGTRVTDEGLRVLAGLPRLQELRLARTKITDEGFQEHLGPKESLLKLDLTGTEVKGKTKRDWKKARPAERDYVD